MDPSQSKPPRRLSRQLRLPDRRRLILGSGALVLAGVGAGFVGLRQLGSMTEYDASVAETRSVLSARPEVREYIRYATLAANGHNTQPWRFQVRHDGVDILPDLTRRTPAVDPDDHHLFASLGCAAENLSIAAAAGGQPGQLSSITIADGGVAFTFGDGPVSASLLASAIPQRQSTRAEYDGRAVSARDLQALAAAAAVPGMDMVLLTDRPRLDRLRDLVLAGNSAQMADAAFLRELKAWIRFNPHQAMATGDGLFSGASGNPALPTWLGEQVFDHIFKVEAENQKYAQHLRSSAGVAVFVSQGADKSHWIAAGRAAQRFALQATALGLKHAYVNQPVEISSLRPELASLVGLPGRRPDLVMRFGYGPTLPFSCRRLVGSVLA